MRRAWRRRCLLPSSARRDPLTLGEYLTRVALVTGEEIGDSGRGVQLMTAHAPRAWVQVVLVTGLEQGLFPSLRNQHEGAKRKTAASPRSVACATWR